MAVQEQYRATNFRRWVSLHLEMYKFELFLMAVFLLCVAHYVLGSRMNRKHAEQWLDEVRGVVVTNFKHCGTQDTDDDTFEYVDGEPVAPKPKS